MKMKRLKKFVSLLVTTALGVLLFGANVIAAPADNAVTYYVKYVDDNNGWRFQTGGWSDTEFHRELYYMLEAIKDGDIVIVDSNGTDEFAELAIPKRISNLTIMQNSHAVLSAPGIDEVYALSGSTSSLTGDVALAHLFDDAGVTFNNNVGDLELIETRAQSTGNTSVTGTTGHVLRRTESGYVYFEAYNVAKGKLLVEYGNLETDASYYSTAPSANQTATAAGAAAQTSTAANAAPQQTTTSSGEYDDVPKTGESSLIWYLLGISALCLAGRRSLKKN